MTWLMNNELAVPLKCTTYLYTLIDHEKKNKGRKKLRVFFQREATLKQERESITHMEVEEWSSTRAQEDWTYDANANDSSDEEDEDDNLVLVESGPSSPQRNDNLQCAIREHNMLEEGGPVRAAFVKQFNTPTMLLDCKKYILNNNACITFTFTLLCFLAMSIGDVTLKHITEVLPHHLTRLSITGNFVSKAGCACLARFLAANTTLTTLDIGGKLTFLTLPKCIRHYVFCFVLFFQTT